jgi:hypothetical protein
LVAKLQQRYDEENVLYEHKIANLFENLRKIENNLKDNSNDLEIECSFWQIQKIIAIIGLPKWRNQSRR